MGSADRNIGHVQPTSSAQVQLRNDPLSSESMEREGNGIQTPSESSEREQDDIQPSSLAAQCKSNHSSRSESTSSEKSLSSYDGDPCLPSSQEETSVNYNSELWFGGMAN